MLTYDLDRRGTIPRYDYLCRCIRDDILCGRLTAGSRLPSRRSLAEHLKVSAVTVESAYAQLAAEGYIVSREKSGYFVSQLEPALRPPSPPPIRTDAPPPGQPWMMDLRGGGGSTELFPFSVWAKLMRQVLSQRGPDLLRPVPHSGVPELREAIAGTLYRLRGLSVSPEQIVVGSGSEYLYNLIVQLLGRELVYGVEDPGYPKPARIYALNGARCISLPVDGQGISPQTLAASPAQVVHLSPSHQFPTGAVTPAGRRQALLRWAAQGGDRYLIEDDYDSEFRFTGLPIPALQSIDQADRVIYLNTFSRALAPSLRISYLVLPPTLLDRYHQRLGSHLDKRIAETYAKAAQATNKNSLYDSYIKAFRWASDRIADCKDGGVVAFISNGAWIDGNAQEGFRKCLEDEYSSIYVLNLRGNQRTSGELSRKEGGKIFGSGSRTPISITFLIKNPEKKGKATILYHDIGDYLSREQKLKKISEFGSVDSSKLQWEIVAPNEKGDWINQRGDVFDSLILLGDKDNKANKQTLFNAVYARGIGSSRDSWAYNYSRQKMLESMKRSNEFYNEQRLKYQEYKRYNPNIDVVSFIDNDPLKISWSRAYRQDVEKNREHFYDVKYASIGLYRPFSKQNLYFDKTVLNDVGPVFNMFPTSIHQNLVICVKGIGDKDFSCLIVDCIPDLQVIFNGQCFPLYWYEENKNKQQTLSLFDTESSDDYIRRDGITDWILKEVRTRFGNARKITKETIFYYVYGLLHSPKYREAFAADLKKSLPRIPIVEDIDAFLDFSYAGKQLANLHLNYEEIPAYEGVTVIGDRQKEEAPDGRMIAGTTDLYAVKVDYKYYEVEKMRFPKKGQKDTIIYNSSIRIENIPDEAYEYIVNGKSAIEWIMERYQVKTDPSSLIKNDPNDWSREHDNPRYILDLLLSVINVSVQTMEIVKKLPDLKLE